jgi:hypothetical protein
MLTRLALRCKLVLGFGIPLLGFLIVVVGSNLVLRHNLKLGTLARQEGLTFMAAVEELQEKESELMSATETSLQTAGNSWENTLRSSHRQFSRQLEKINKLSWAKNFRKTIDNLESNANQLLQVGLASAEQISESDPETLNSLLSRFRSAESRVQTQIVQLRGEVHRQLSATLEELTDSARAGVTRSTILASILVPLLLILPFFFSRIIMRPFENVTGKLRSSADELLEDAEMISSGSSSIADSATQQAAFLEETSASLEEISTMTTRNSQDSKEAFRLFGEVGNSVNEGRQAVGRLAEVMNRIKASAEETGKIIKLFY